MSGLQAEACYHLDFNAGQPPGGAICPLASADRSKVADQLGLPGLEALLSRIVAAHSQVGIAEQAFSSQYQSRVLEHGLRAGM